MVSVLGIVICWVSLMSASDASPGARLAATTPQTRPILQKEGLPWYDAKADRIQPLLSWPDLGGGVFKPVRDWFSRVFERIRSALRTVGSWLRWMNRWRIPGIGGLGDLVAVGLAVLALTLVVVGLLELLRRYRPIGGDTTATRARTLRGGAQRIEGLPAGFGFDAADPWAEAQRRRAAGDLAGAVIYLFAHQLLILERLKQIRLIPGRTGRQLVRSVNDRGVRAAVEPTLRLFEAVYYGQRTPEVDAFESAWAAGLRLVEPASPEAGV